MAVKADDIDVAYMNQALSLALKGSGKTSPNPMVGAVLVKNRRVIAKGYHARAGADHAEIMALKEAGRRAAGGTLYVTLEPCCHTGRTGPCTEAIIKAGVERVVYALKDPNRDVNGKGAAKLRRAGIEVKSGVLRQRAAEINERYLGHLKNGRPWVTLKLAQTIDGNIATLTGDSKWVTSPESLKLAHRLRAENDAVLVGMGTVRADNPSLTVRRVRGKNPYRIVVSGRLDFPRNCRLLTANGDGRTIIASTPEAINHFTRRRKYDNLTFWEVRIGRDGRPDLKQVMMRAEEFGLQSILVEGGGQLAASFLKAGLVDKFHAIIAPKLAGAGIPSVADLGIDRISAAVLFDKPSFVASGPDMVFTGYPRRRK